MQVSLFPKLNTRQSDFFGGVWIRPLPIGQRTVKTEQADPSLTPTALFVASSAPSRRPEPLPHPADGFRCPASGLDDRIQAHECFEGLGCP